MESIVRQTVQGVIVAALHPRTLIQIVLQVSSLVFQSSPGACLQLCWWGCCSGCAAYCSLTSWLIFGHVDVSGTPSWSPSSPDLIELVACAVRRLCQMTARFSPALSMQCAQP